MRYRCFFFSLCILLALLQQHADLSAQPNQIPENGKIKLYIKLSQSYAQNQPDSAVYYANEGIRLAQKVSDRQSQASLLLVLGHINLLHRHPELARSFFNEALSLYRLLHDASSIAHAYDQLSLLEGNTQNFSTVLKYYQDSRDSSGLIETYEDMGRSLEFKGEHEKALSYYLRALTQYEYRKHKPEAYFALLESISKLYQQKGDSATAMKYLKEGIRKSKTQGTSASEIQLLNYEGELLATNHDDLKALVLYKQALVKAKKDHQPNEQASALIGIAGILKKQDVKTSITDLKQALDIAKTLNAAKLEARIYEALAGLYRQQKNYNEAMDALTEGHNLIDSLLSADTVKEIAALDSSYVLERTLEKTHALEKVNRLEKAELWLAIMLMASVLLILSLFWLYLQKVKRLNKQLQHLNEDLTNSNRIKDTLFSVIGHDLKGPAGSAAQLLELMETEDFTPEEMQEIIGELRKQTTASLQLLQALFEWGKAQLQGVEVKQTDFAVKPLVERCLHLLNQQAAQKNIQMFANVPDGLKLHADADHLEFIIRNVLSNAIKFSYEGGAVTIDACLPSKGEAVLSVKDNGIGISPDQQAAFLTGNLKVNFGTKKEQGSGLGLLLTKDFIKANHGRIWLESEEGRGTRVFVAMPAF